MDEHLFHPQGTLTKKERDINTFIHKKVFNIEFVAEVPCNIDPESGLTDICISQDRIDYYSKYERILLLPAYLNNEQALTPEDFFNELVFISDTKNFNTYENQKDIFLKNMLQYHGWHVSSYSLIPNYSDYLEAINKIIKFSIEKNIIQKNSYVDSLSKVIDSSETFDISMATAAQKSEAFYNIFNENKSNNEKVICFFDRKS